MALAPGRERDKSRVYVSGSQKRKAKKEKDESERQILSKTPKIDALFKKKSDNGKDGDVHGDGDTSENEPRGGHETGSHSDNHGDSDSERERNAYETDANMIPSSSITSIAPPCIQLQISIPTETSPQPESPQSPPPSSGVPSSSPPPSPPVSPSPPPQQITPLLTSPSTAKTSTEAATLLPEVSTGVYASNDIGQWPEKIINSFRDHWLREGGAKCRNISSGFEASKTIKSSENHARYCSISFFSRVHPKSKEKIDHTWLCYSPSTGKLFCFICKLLSTDASAFTTGFNDWKHGYERIESHRSSQQHRDALSSYVLRCKKVDVGHLLVEEFEMKTNYWRSVLTRVVDVLVFLCERGLAIRGKDEIIGSAHNGNFLGIIELLSIYDPFLKRHIETHGNKGQGTTSYLSHSICDELIRIMANMVMETIVAEVQQCKYYSISVDSTPDITHTDQLSHTIRYVLPSVGPVERFLSFIPISDHTGEGIADVALIFFADKKINIEYCRGQSYDNASNMSGKYKGVQSRIKSVCKYADYVPCTAHSLNLVGVCAVESCKEASSLFSLIQSIYVFYSASTSLWKKQLDALKASSVTSKDTFVVKQLSDTRWSARHDAVHALNDGYETHVNLLCEISDSDETRAEVRSTSRGLSKRLKQLETGTLVSLWDVLLERINMTSKMLQTEGLPINRAVILMRSLSVFIKSQRDRLEHFIHVGVQKSGSSYFRKDQRKVTLKELFNIVDDEIAQSSDASKALFRINTFFPIIDRLVTELDTRLKAYEGLSDKFGFLTNLHLRTPDELRISAQKLVECYPDDLDGELESELIHFAAIIEGLLADKSLKIGKCYEIDVFLQLKENNLLEAFPNVYTMMSIYLCIFVANCKGERSFSKLKLILNYLRNTMGQERLSSLALLSIENKLLRTLDFNDVINRFAAVKARRKDF